MQERGTLMDLFRNRPIQPLTPPKMAKKPKPTNFNQDQDDPLKKVLGWRDQLKNMTVPDAGTYKLIQIDSITEDDQEMWGKNFEGILIDVDWQNMDFEEFNKLKIGDDLMDNGIVFVWGSNSNIGPLFRYFANQGFQYVENFMFAMLDRQKIPTQKIKSNTNNLFNYFKKKDKTQQQIQKQKNKEIKDFQTGRVSKPQQIFLNMDSDYFLQSQKVLYLFRKQNKNKALELRHQRTSDAFFTIGNSNQLDWKSMQVVYKMIETLLIKANYKKDQPLKLLQLWGKTARKGWVTVSERQKNKK